MFVAFTLGLLLIAGSAASEEGKESKKHVTPTRKQALVIGKVSNNPKKHFKYLKPIAEYVALHMKDLGIREARVLLAKDNKELIRYLKQGKVDWVTETPFSAVLFKESAGAEMLLRRWKKGVPEYYTVFITHKDSNIKSLADLKGRTIAFEDPGSTSAFFIPYYIMRKKGLNLVQLETLREKPPENMVGYIFAGQEINMSTWLHKKLIAAVSYSNLDWIKEDHTPLAFKKDFIIFHQTQPFPRMIELVRKGLDPKLKVRLKEVLTNAHNDPEAQEALRNYQKTTKFDELDDKAWNSLEETRRIIKFIQREIE